MSKAIISGETQVRSPRNGDAPTGNVVRVDFGRRRPPYVIVGPGWYHDEAIREERDAQAMPPR